MGETPTPVDIKDPQIQAHFQDFSGDHDKRHKELAQTIIERNRELFQSLKIHTPRVEDPHDGSTRIVIWTWDTISPGNKDRLHEKVGYPIEFQTPGKYSDST